MSGIKARKGKGLLIVDSNLRLFHVEPGRIKSGRGLFRGYNIWFDRNVVVDLNIRDEGKTLTLDDLKAMILNHLIDEDIDEFYDFSSDPNDERSFRLRLAQAASFGEIGQIFNRQ